MAAPSTMVDMTALASEHLTALAREHLDEAGARAWLGLLRPAVLLRPAGPGEPAVARLGGSPDLPPRADRPRWPGEGPLRLVAEVDLAAVAAAGLDAGLRLASTGRLLAFCYDDPDGTGAIVDAADPGTAAGWRLLHLEGVGPALGAHTALAGVQVLTWPDSEHPVLEIAGVELPDAMEERLGELLDDAVGEDAVGHQLGGWARPVQGAVEWEAAEARLGAATWDEEHRREALRWRPLLQVDGGADSAWGDAGCLYWLARTDGTRPPEPSELGFTWQTG